MGVTGLGPEQCREEPCMHFEDFSWTCPKITVSLEATLMHGCMDIFKFSHGFPLAVVLGKYILFQRFPLWTFILITFVHCSGLVKIILVLPSFMHSKSRSVSTVGKHLKCSYSSQGSSPLTKCIKNWVWTRIQGSDIPQGKGRFRIQHHLI